MGQWEWRAWIGAPDGGKLGAAFLVTPTKLLTCAHVVRDLPEVRVGFPGLPGAGLARVHRFGDWRMAGDYGDVAVLELPAPVGQRPAPLARPDSLYEPLERTAANPLGRRVLHTYGFPRRKDDDERFATVSTGPDMVQRQEWWQLRTEPGHWLEKGFSGAAVYDPYSGEVVGMVTDAELGQGDRGEVGKMLPITSLRRYWEEFDDHLPLTWLSAPARRELRLLLGGRPADDSEAARVLGRPSGRPYRSAWEVVRHVAEGLSEERLLDHLARLARTVPGLDDWAARHACKPGPAPAGGGPASVIVQLERTTFGHDITVRTWVDGAAGPARATVQVGDKERDVRTAVEDEVARARRTLGDRPWMIEFAVPDNWLSKPFEEWYLDRADELRMRLRPVVVRDVERMRPGSYRRDLARERWDRLTAGEGDNPYAVECVPPKKRDFKDWLEANDQLGVLVYGTRPERAHLAEALKLGVPVIFWPRTKCPDDDHADCTGRHLGEALRSGVAGSAPAELPEVAWRLRKDSLVARKDQPHCGRGLTLLWDDPSRVPPEPPLAIGDA